MSDSASHPNKLTFVVFPSETKWVAMCIERYIGAQGDTPEEAMRGLQIAYRAELDESLARTGEPFGGIPPAPDKFREMYESGNHKRGYIYDDGLGAGMVDLVGLAA